MSNGPYYVMPSQPQSGWVPPAPLQPQVAMPAPPPAKLTIPPPPVAMLPPADPMRPKVRAVREDMPPRLVLPSPESLGIAVAAPAPTAVDWNQMQARLERLGVVRLGRDRLPEGGYRVVLGLPTHQVEATGMTEAAAVLLALERAESLGAAR
jgi:hypothetical protein